MDAFAESNRLRRNRTGPLARERAFVKSAFARDDEIRGGELRPEIEPRGDQVEAGQKACAGGRHEAEAESASGARAGQIEQGIWSAAVVREHHREPRGRMIKVGNLPGAQAFLRTVDGRGPAVAEQRIRDVAGDPQRGKITR